MIWGKRIIRQTSELMNALQFAILFYGFYVILDKEVFSWVALVGFILIWQLQLYYRGIKYTIYSDNQKNLIRDIEIGLKEIEVTKFEKVQEDKKTIFVLAESKKKIVLIQKDSTFKKERTYELVFLKWKGREARREILYLIETSLLEDEGGRAGKIKMGFHFVMLLMGIVLALLMISKAVMEPEQLTLAAMEAPPTRVYLVDEDRYIPISDEVLALHELAKGAYTNRNMGNRGQDLMTNTNIRFYYDAEAHSGDVKEVINKNENSTLKENKGKIIYVGQSSGTAFIPHSEIGNKSPVHKILWRVYQIYRKTEGNYYFVFNGDYNQWKKIVEDILDSNQE